MIRILFLALFIFVCSTAPAQTFTQLNEKFVELFQKEDYANAVIVGEQALVKAKAEFGVKDANYAVAVYNLAEGYFALKEWDKALPYYRQAIPVYTIANKTAEVLEVALINNSIGTIYYVKEQFDSAAVYFNRSANYFLSHPKDNYTNLFLTSKNLTDTYFKIDDYKGLLNASEKTLPIIAKEKGQTHEEYYTMLYNKGHALYYLNRFAESEKSLIVALKTAEKLFGKENDEYAALLIMLFKALKEQNRFADAEPYILESTKILEALPQKDTMTLAMYYKGAGDFYSDNGHFKNAEEFYEKSLGLLRASGGVNSEIYNSTLQSRAYSYIQEGRLMEAKKLLTELLAVYNTPTTGDNANAAELLIVLSNAEAQLGEPDAAEIHVQEGMSILKKLFKDGNALLPNAYEVLGMVYYKRGENTKSIAAYKHAIELADKYFGKESRLAASFLSNLGITYQVMGEYALAETELKKSLQIRKKILGPDHPEYALSLVNLAMVHVMQSQYTEADKMLVEAIKIFVDKKMVNTTTFISVLNNVALMEQHKGQLEVSKNLYFRILGILQQREDKSLEPLILVYNNIGGLYVEEKKFDSAIIYVSNSLNLLEKSNRVNTTEFIKSANSLMMIYKGMGDYASANKVSNKLLPLTKQVMGEDAELLGTIYSNIAMLEQVQGRKDKASGYIQAGNAILLNHFRKNFYVLSEKEKLEWWEKKSFLFNLFPSLLMQYNITSGPQVEAMTDQQLQLKGFVLQDAAANLRKARASATPAILKLLTQWQSNKSFLNKLYSLPVSERKYSTDSLEQVTNELEKQVNQSASKNINEAGLNINWKSVQASLHPDEAAIEFMQFPFYRNGVYTDTMQYAAIVIRKDLSSPQFILLASEKKLAQYFTTGTTGEKEVAINKLYRGVHNTKTGADNFMGDSLYASIWQPLMPYLQNVKKVSFAPDGILHKLAFHALPMSADKILIDNFQLQQYSGIRQLAETSETTSTSINAAYLLGNPDFNSSQSKTVTQKNNNTSTWSALPGTEQEIISLQKLFLSRNIKTEMVSSAKANEESFKTLSNRSPGIIHLATHGFFLRQKEVDKKDNDVTALSGGEQNLAMAENPLLRSGIVLAGANKAWRGDKLPGTAEDGIVTAYEISQLNLSGTGLVVLSACETALGDVQGTEGVFGLQRAFKIAGVKNLIVSLWQVPDKETAELMTFFYTNLLNKEPVREAFYKAQKAMREKYPPFMWAAFVLIE